MIRTGRLKFGPLLYYRQGQDHIRIGCPFGRTGEGKQFSSQSFGTQEQPKQFCTALYRDIEAKTDIKFAQAHRS